MGVTSRAFRVALGGLVASLAACTAETEPVASDVSDVTAKTFDSALVLSDEALTDDQAVTVADVQAFLERTPHGNRSVLATVVSHDRTAAEAFVFAGKKYGINPLVLMTRAQLEQGLLSKTSASRAQLDWAMGCGCPDNRDCIEAFRGFDVQIECAAERLRTYLDEMAASGTSIAGWGVGVPKRTLDGHRIVPRNRATAAIYTYTPWLSSAKNHTAIWRKYAETLAYVARPPGGCPVTTFPSGVRVQLRPSTLGDQYAGATCFLDTWQLVDPVEHLVFDTSAKVAENFTFAEFAGRSKTTEILLSPVLVKMVQALRAKLGSSVSIDVGYRTPEEHASCGSSCSRLGELTQGTAVMVKSGAGAAAVLDAAIAVGMPTCFEQSGSVFVGIGAPAQGCRR